MTTPFVPDHAPFPPEQRAWLNGFLAGIFVRRPEAAPAAAAANASGAPLRPLTVLWGSQTGTAEALAKKAAKLSGQRGFAPTVLDMAAVSLTALAQNENLLVITSTYGDGEPPDNARSLHEELCAPAVVRSGNGPAATPSAATTDVSLRQVRYSVCALGDSNYPLFCQCGKEFDDALQRRGATRVYPSVECDVDYEEPFTRWLEAALAALGAAGSEAAAASPVALSVAAPAAVAGSRTSAPQVYSKTNPFSAAVLSVRRLNAPASAKEVNHVELSLNGSSLTYEAGDALGVWPQNCPELVDEILALLQCDGEEPVPTPAGERPLRTALLHHYDLGKPAPTLLQQFEIAPATGPLQVIDALASAGIRRPDLRTFVTALRKLQPRLYSISSSLRASPGQVHLTVGAVRYEAAGRARKGVCSTFLADRSPAAGTVGVYVHANPSFRLPADPTTPIIMIGPGTGIAPFRAFLQERAAAGAPGQNWLFFGDQRATTDFLYRDELEGWQADGLLTRLSTAFSRDQEQKLYVQHRMREEAAELWAWLERGAHVYVCGDASRMARDVEAALQGVIEEAGRRSPAEAAAYLQLLRTGKRYARDVY